MNVLVRRYYELKALLIQAITTLSKEFDSKGKRRQVWPEDRIILTANLNINYRSPTKVNQFLVIKSILIEVGSLDVLG